MLQEDVQFRIKMRNCLRGIEHLDPETIGPRLRRLDAEIAEMRASIGVEPRRPAFEIVSIGAAKAA